MTGQREWGVLLSHASEQTIPGLVIGGFASARSASEDGTRTARAAGVRFKLMRKRDGEWADSAGRSPVEAIRDGSARGFRGGGWL